MISVKYALILVATFVAGASIFASPVPQAIAAVIATDVQCTGCVGAADLASSAVTTTKLASNSVNGGKVTDQSLSAADLGPDSVGASEIKGVTKLIFIKCSFTPGSISVGSGIAGIGCSAPGAAQGDSAVGTVNSGNSCIILSRAVGYSTNVVTYDLINNCPTAQDPGTVLSSIIVYKT